MDQLIDDVGSVGIIVDIDPRKLPAGAWSDGENVRFDGYSVQKVAGSRTIFGSLSESAHSLFYYDTIDGVHHFVYAGLTQVFLIDNAVHHNITRVTVSGTVQPYSADAAELWTGGVYGGLLFLNNINDHPQIQLTPTASARLSNLPNWPTTVTTRCACLRAFKDVLVALDVTKGSTRYRQMVKWSDGADPLTVPGSWDETSPTTDAGEFNLTETPGAVVDCLPLRDVNIIYKDDSVWAMQAVPNNDIFRFYKIFPDVGILAKRCVTAFESSHAFIGNDLDFYVHDGNQLRSIGQDKWRNWLRENIDTTNFRRCWVLTNPTTTEIWFGIVTGDAAYPTRVLMWNWRHNTWGLRRVNNVSGGAVGVIQEAQFAWSALTDTWATFTETWDELSSVPPVRKLVLASPSNLNGLVETEFGTLELGNNLSFYVERNGLWTVPAKGSGMVDLQSIKFVRRVRFRTVGSPANGSVSFRVSVQNDLDDAISYSTTTTVVNNTAEVVVAKRGRFLDLRVESTANVVFQLLSIEVEYEPSGRY